MGSQRTSLGAGEMVRVTNSKSKGSNTLTQTYMQAKNINAQKKKNKSFFKKSPWLSSHTSCGTVVVFLNLGF